MPSKTPEWKAATLAAVFGLAMVSYPAHAAPASGSDTVQGLYDVLLSTMKNGRKANGELVNVDYMMRRNGDSWLISDIYLDGAISEVATRHSEFAAILKSQGIDGLIATARRTS